jgi:hypothetical protein
MLLAAYLFTFRIEHAFPPHLSLDDYISDAWTAMAALLSNV